MPFASRHDCLGEERAVRGASADKAGELVKTAVGGLGVVLAVRDVLRTRALLPGDVA
jgi:hypothetical protein